MPSIMLHAVVSFEQDNILTKIQMKKDNFKADLMLAKDVALLNHKAMHDAASHKNKTTNAFIVLVIAALISGIGLKFFGGFFSPSWGMVISMSIYQIVSSIIGIYVLSVVAKSVFKGHAKHDAFFRVMAFGMIVTWLSIIPALSIVGGIWALVVVFTALKVVHKLTTGGAIGALLVTIVAMAIVGMILAPTLGALGIRGMHMGSGSFKGGNFGDVYKNGFKMNVNTDEGTGSVKMEDGKMTIEGPDGEKMEIEIPGQ